MHDADQFEAHRPLMFSIAYRMLGSAAEAEDIVQEAYLRYHASAPEQIVSPKAFFSTVITRLCLNQLQSARAQRESYIGPWLPEPVLTDGDERFDPADRAEQYESISLAFLVLLEQLTPIERAVFLLREVFDYNYDELAAMVGKQEAACRQIFSRAKKHISAQRPRFKPEPEAHRQLLSQFFQAVETGDLERLRQMLTSDVTLVADGGGKALDIVPQPLQGRDAVVQFLVAARRLAAKPNQLEMAEINGEPAVILRNASRARLVISMSSAHGQVSAIRLIGNPDKLVSVNEALEKNHDVT